MLTAHGLGRTHQHGQDDLAGTAGRDRLSGAQLRGRRKARALWPKAKAEYFECRHRKHRRNADSLGIQLGLDLDFSDVADAFYVGGLFEPITGLSFNAGISMREGNYLQPGFQRGQLITADEDRQGDERYMVRPYIGVTLSADILRALVDFRNKARAGNKGGA